MIGWQKRNFKTDVVIYDLHGGNVIGNDWKNHNNILILSLLVFICMEIKSQSL